MVAKLDAVTAEFAKLSDDIVAFVVERFDEIARETAGRAVGGTMTLHGRGGKRTPVTLGTSATVQRINGNAYAVIHGTPTAMWVWLEKGTQPHPIGIRRDNKTTFLHGPRYEHPIAGPMIHPGSTGKRTWTRAIDTFHAEFPNLVVRLKGEVFRAIR